MAFLFGPSNDKKVHVYIEVAERSRKESYQAKDVIEGEVFLDVVHNGFKADALSLRFEGGEKTCTHWTTSSGTGTNRSTQHHYIHQSRSVVNIPMQLALFNKR